MLAARHDDDDDWFLGTAKKTSIHCDEKSLLSLS